MDIYLIEKGKGESDGKIRKCLTHYLPQNPNFVFPRISPGPENPGEAVIQRTAKGKPMLRDYPEVHFSVSHSEKLWACAFSRDPVGLDLEKRDSGISKRKTGNTEERYLRIARRFFSTEEFDYVKENGALGFYQIWVRKEAYGKYTGEGLFPSFKELDTVAEGALRQAIGNIKFEGIDLELVGYPGYEAVCCLPSESREEVRIHTWNEERQERWERQR